MVYFFSLSHSLTRWYAAHRQGSLFYPPHLEQHLACYGELNTVWLHKWANDTKLFLLWMMKAAPVSGVLKATVFVAGECSCDFWCKVLFFKVLALCLCSRTPITSMCPSSSWFPFSQSQNSGSAGANTAFAREGIEHSTESKWPTFVSLSSHVSVAWLIFV